MKFSSQFQHTHFRWLDGLFSLMPGNGSDVVESERDYSNVGLDAEKRDSRYYKEELKRLVLSQLGPWKMGTRPPAKSGLGLR